MAQLAFSIASEVDAVFGELCDLLKVEHGPGWPDAFGTQLREYMRTRLSQPINTLSLFSGAGGLDIGFHDAGFDIHQMVEIDTRYAATLDRNSKPNGYFGHGVVSAIDIADLLRSEPLQFKGRVDFIIGGPPCQTFSAAGRRAAGVLGTTEARGTLFEEYVRLLDCLQPRAFLFENVYGITGAEKGQAWARIQEAFESVGYALHYRVLDTADYGAPQHRERMFIVGTRGVDFRFPRPTHGPDSPDGRPFYTPGEALAGMDVSSELPSLTLKGKYAPLLPEIPPGLNYSFFTEKMGHPRPLFAWRSKFSDFLYKADPEVPVRTIKAFCGKYTGPFHWDNRRFSVKELKRLQTFPDDYPLEGSRGACLQQIGNSVPPQIARMLAIAVVNQIFEQQDVVPLSYLSKDEKLTFRQRKRSLSTAYKRKAEKAIRKLRPQEVRRPTGATNYEAVVDDTFAFRIDSEDATHRVDIEDDSPVALKVRCTRDRRRKRPAFSIQVQPTEGMSWGLPFERIELSGTELTRDDYLVAWKAVQNWLAEHRLRDDLVQLYGYYAYEPLAVNTMSVEGQANWKWSKLKDVVAGVGVRQIHTGDELCDILRVSKTQLRSFLLFLRDLGHEVRSSRTNPQIPDGSYLIPYAFPTLSRESVQRTKSLF